MMDTKTEKLWQKIKYARACLELIQRQRTNLAGALSHTMGMMTSEIEYPEPDTAEVYLCMFGHKPAHPNATYRLKFGKPLVWMGMSHVWGVKPADIVVE